MTAGADARSLSADERAEIIRDHLIETLGGASASRQIDAIHIAVEVLNAIERAGLGPDRAEVILSLPRYEFLLDSLFDLGGLDAPKASAIRDDPHSIGKLYGIEFAVSVESSDSRLRYMDPTEELSVVVLPAAAEVR